MNTNIRFDLARQARIGLPEAVFCEGKDPAALESLFTRFAAPQATPILFTRLSPTVFHAQSEAVRAAYDYDELPAAFNAWDKGMVGEYRPINLKAAEVAERSGLTYTVLRPVWLTDKPTEGFQFPAKARPTRARKPPARASAASWPTS